MLNHIHCKPVTIDAAIAKAEQYLLDQQDLDGCWRDYQLAPGYSESWTTAVVCWSLACLPPHSAAFVAVESAVLALYDLKKENGWGYNRKTATDADSTAWTCRVLGRLCKQQDNLLIKILLQYLHPEGQSATFLKKDVFGTWAGHHSDVQPMIGLSLLQCQAASEVKDEEVSNIISSMRTVVLETPGDWTSFWWTTPAYAIACNLEFLHESGGIPESINNKTIHWLQQSASPQTAFEAAQLLKIAVLVSHDSQLLQYFSGSLLQWQLEDGSWPASAVLLVPEQFPGQSVATLQNNKTAITAFEDQRRLMSTSMALLALKALLQAQQHTFC